MLPLVKPIFPSPESIWSHFRRSLEASHLSNFGPCHDLLVERLGGFPVLSNNGTDAIRLAAQVTLRGRVAIPDYTHSGTLQAVVAAGLTPVLFPADPDTWTLDLAVLKRYANEWDSAIVVSPFGYDVDVLAYDTFFQEHGRPCVYDFAGAWGHPRSDVFPTAVSLHATKAISCGEGGITFFCNSDDQLRAKRLTNFDTLPDRSIGTLYAGNMKPDELKCAVVLAQLDSGSFERRVARKLELLEVYRRLGYAPKAWYPSLCVVSGIRELKDCGFVSKRYYPLLSKMNLPVKTVRMSPYLFETCVALPSDCTVEEAEYVCSQFGL